MSTIHEQLKGSLADGFYFDMPFEEYAAIPALNGSSIVHMKRSPMYYKHCIDNPEPPTPAMILGTAVHRMILEPHRVDDLAIWGSKPEHLTANNNLRPRNGRDWEAFESANRGKLIVTLPESKKMIGMAVAARKNAPIRKYADMKGRTEVVMLWTDPVSKRRMKGRLDKLTDKGHIIFDLKTTRDCSKYRFGGQAYQLGYHIKMAMYANGYRALTGHDPKLVLGAIESKPPHESAVYRITTDVLLQGYEDLDALIGKLAQCEQTDTWPAAEPDEVELSLPTYAYTEQTDDLSDLALVEE